MAVCASAVGLIGTTIWGALSWPARPGTAMAQGLPFSEPAAGRIVYTRQDGESFNMFTSDPDGTNERRLSDIDDSAAGEDQPRWSPDGRHVAFTSYPDGLTSIHILTEDGGAMRTVVEGDGTSGDPAWSPDGRCLVYDGGVGPSEDDQKKLDLKIWCDDGSEKGVVRRLTNTPDIDEREPDWSPDGEEIVFAARSNHPNTTDRWELWRIRPDGTGREIAVARPDSHERHPRFAPDGRRLAFITGPQPFSFGTLAVVERAGQTIERYVNGPSDSLTWSPDGTEILFASIYRTGLRDPAAFSPAAFSPAAVLQGVQHAGLYRIQLSSRSISRLHGAAGGALAPNVGTNFEFGYMPDWTRGTATPTPDATATPTPSNTPPPTATATATLEPTPTPPRIYLPITRLDATEEPTPTSTPTAEATVEGTAMATVEGTVEATPTGTAVP